MNYSRSVTADIVVYGADVSETAGMDERRRSVSFGRGRVNSQVWRVRLTEEKEKMERGGRMRKSKKREEDNR